MSKADERAAKARSLILKGEQKSVVAEQLGYKSVGGMMNAIVMLEHREKIGHATPYKAVRAMQSPEKSGLEIKKPQEKVDVLGETWQGGIRTDVTRDNGLYARLEGRFLLTSYIGYRKSVNIEAKCLPGRSIRLFEAELGAKGALLMALKELREMIEALIALIEGHGEEQDQ